MNFLKTYIVKLPGDVANQNGVPGYTALTEDHDYIQGYESPNENFPTTDNSLSTVSQSIFLFLFWIYKYIYIILYI